MFKNYFKIAWRNIIRNKMSSAINIGGLAVGMAVAIFIGLWIYDELSYNKYYKNYEHIAQVMQRYTVDGKINSQVSDPFPMGKELQTKYGSDFKYVVMASWQGDHILSFNDKYLSKEGIYMDKDADKMLSLKMQKGTYGGLSQPNSILLSASAAKAFFGDIDPIGKAMKIDNRMNVNVTGVYEDMPKNTTFSDAAFIAPWALFGGSEEWIRNARDYNLWDNNSFQVFVQLADNADFNTVNKKIYNLNYDHHTEENKKLYNPHVFLHPIRSWHLYNRFENGKSVGGAIEYVWMFLTIGIAIGLYQFYESKHSSQRKACKRGRHSKNSRLFA
jgi:putative ABC transport system permease protein